MKTPWSSATSGNTLPMTKFHVPEDIKLPQKLNKFTCSRFSSSGMWRCVTWVSGSWHFGGRGCLNLQQSNSPCFTTQPLKTKALCSSKTVGTTHPKPAQHIPEDLNPQPHICQYFKLCRLMCWHSYLISGNLPFFSPPKSYAQSTLASSIFSLIKYI
jgi:hypothetical protein